MARTPTTRPEKQPAGKDLPVDSCRKCWHPRRRLQRSIPEYKAAISKARLERHRRANQWSMPLQSIRSNLELAFRLAMKQTVSRAYLEPNQTARRSAALEASKAATQTTPGATKRSNCVSGPIPKGKRLTTITKKKSVDKTSARRLHASVRSRATIQRNIERVEGTLTMQVRAAETNLRRCGVPDA